MSSQSTSFNRFAFVLILTLIPGLNILTAHGSPPRAYWAPRSLAEIALELRFFGQGPVDIEEYKNLLRDLDQLEDPIQYESLICRKIGLTSDIRIANWYLGNLYLSGNPKLSSKAVRQLIGLFGSSDFESETLAIDIENHYKELATYLISRTRYQGEGSMFRADPGGVLEVRVALQDSFIKAVNEGQQSIINRYLEHFAHRDMHEAWKKEIYRRFRQIYLNLQTDRAKQNLLTLMIEESERFRQYFPSSFVMLIAVIAEELESLTSNLRWSVIRTLKAWPGKKDFVPLLESLAFREGDGLVQTYLEALFACRGGYCKDASDPTSFGDWGSPSYPWYWPRRARARMLEWRDLTCFRTIKLLKSAIVEKPTKQL